MQPMESGDLQALRKLVQKATNQNEERLDAAPAKQIRDFAKKSEDNVRLVQELLMDRLKWPHAEVRLMLRLDFVWQALLKGLAKCQCSLTEATFGSLMHLRGTLCPADAPACAGIVRPADAAQ